MSSFMKSRVTAPDAAREREPFRNGVDRDHTLGTEQKRALDGELADGTAAPDRDRLAAFEIAEIGGHVAGRKDVRQEQHLLVAQSRRDLDGADIGVGHAQILGLAAGNSRRADANSRTVRQASAPTASRPPSRSGWIARSRR